MSSTQNVKQGRAEPAGSALPIWWLVFRREFAELWVGGRALILLILFCIMMSVTSVLREIESNVSLIPPKEMVFLTLESAIAFGLFISLIISADSISGERERDTLETMLLTPTSRLQIVLGKFLAALSPWPVAFALSIPYMAILSKGHEVFGQALLWGALAGSLLVLGFTGLGMLLSIWSNSNKTSLFLSLLIYVLLLIPTQWTWQAQVGAVGDLLQAANPMEATHQFLEKVLVNNRTLEEMANHLVADTVFASVTVGLLFLYAAPRLRLEGGAPRLRLARRRNAVVALLVSALLIASSVLGAPLQAQAPQTEPPTNAEQPLEISIDMEYQTVKTGDVVEFATVITNNGEVESPPLHVAMNIINLGQGDPVDPEDWSPERTQELEPLPPGESAELSWQVNTILDGDYMVYMTVVPKPASPESTTQPVSSPGIHLTVQAFTRTNPGGVLPIAIGIPVALALGALFVRRRWRGKSGAAGSQAAE